MKSNIYEDDLPLGLGMALAKNHNAMNKFSSLTPQQKQQAINYTHKINSKQEMAEFAREIADGVFKFI